MHLKPELFTVSGWTVNHENWFTFTSDTLECSFSASAHTPCVCIYSDWLVALPLTLVPAIFAQANVHRERICDGASSQSLACMLHRTTLPLHYHYYDNCEALLTWIIDTWNYIPEHVHTPHTHTTHTTHTHAHAHTCTHTHMPHTHMHTRTRTHTPHTPLHSGTRTHARTI